MLFLIACSLLVASAAGPTAKPGMSVDQQTFRLVKEGQAYYLVGSRDEKTAVPLEWLCPRVDSDESESYVSSCRFDETVSAFPLGGGFIGLHLSSYDTGEGSAMAAAGRDVFIIFEERTKKAHPGMNPGITKERGRSICMFATFHDFFISDINHDGFTDIGVVKERIWCDTQAGDDEGKDSHLGPF